MQLVLALDQGTTSSRAILFGRDGTAHAIAQKEFRQIFPQPGWVEHDATEIWATQSGVMNEALAKARVGARDIAAIGITNQRETTVVWERATGRPIANAIVWQDRRTAPMCDELRAAGHARNVRGQDGARARRVLFRHQAALAARPRRRRAGTRGARRARVRHHRRMARLEPHRRARALHRREQREPHAAVQHPHRGLGRRASAHPRRPALGAARKSSRLRVFAARRRSATATFPSQASPETSRRRCSDRPASRRALRRTPTAPAASCC